MKNIPITARIKNKGQVREPLLNVGPAGVYGDNTTSDAATKPPATGKKKECKDCPDDSPFKLTSPLKQVGDEVKPAGVSTPGSAGELIQKEGTGGDCPSGFSKNSDGICVMDTPQGTEESNKSFREKCYDANGNRKRGVPGCSWADETTAEPEKTDCSSLGEGFTYNPESKKCEKMTKGTKPSLDGATYLAKGDVNAPWETRQNIRNFKISKNRQKNASKQTARYKDALARNFGESTPKPGEKGYKRYMNLKNKLANSQQYSDAMIEGMNNAQRQIQQNLNKDSKLGVTGVNTSGQYNTQITGSNVGDQVTKQQVLDKVELTKDSPNKMHSSKKLLFGKKGPLKKGYFKK